MWSSMRANSRESTAGSEPSAQLLAGCGNNCGGGCSKDGAGSTKTPAVEARSTACRGDAREGGCGGGEGSTKMPAVGRSQRPVAPTLLHSWPAGGAWMGSLATGHARASMRFPATGRRCASIGMLATGRAHASMGIPATGHRRTSMGSPALGRASMGSPSTGHRRSSMESPATGRRCASMGSLRPAAHRWGARRWAARRGLGRPAFHRWESALHYGQIDLGVQG
ncbi:hypothetical protein OsJ_35649 [Oryza sativa Japonica Group]|uniref:Uncharacterized protein n=1 Tax=Oryza sativa subsp. japonica TaxID=39947 RepID=B9GCH4_ORYSJ|nr:hypothetical protein OsJ_35649 [Oryza sativa Japonica Group]